MRATSQDGHNMKAYVAESLLWESGRARVRRYLVGRSRVRPAGGGPRLASAGPSLLRSSLAQKVQPGIWSKTYVAVFWAHSQRNNCTRSPFLERDRSIV
eukprot:1143858-Pleurochrysis_carterae.AAC.1